MQTDLPLAHLFRCLAANTRAHVKSFSFLRFSCSRAMHRTLHFRCLAARWQYVHTRPSLAYRQTHSNTQTNEANVWYCRQLLLFWLSIYILYIFQRNGTFIINRTPRKRCSGSLKTLKTTMRAHPSDTNGFVA